MATEQEWAALKEAAERSPAGSLVMGRASTILALEAEHSRLRAENERLREELADARLSVITFCGPWAVQHASEHGLPAGHIFAEHYDILEKAGARMDSFTRMDSAARAAIAQEGE